MHSGHYADALISHSGHTSASSLAGRQRRRHGHAYECRRLEQFCCQEDTLHTGHELRLTCRGDYHPGPENSTREEHWLWERYTHTHTFNGPFSRTTQVIQYQKGKTNLDFTKARDSEWQWHQLGHMQVCTLLQTDNYANTSPLSFLQARCPSCRPTNSVKALKALWTLDYYGLWER